MLTIVQYLRLVEELHPKMKVDVKLGSGGAT